MREAIVVSALDSAKRAEELGLGANRIVISAKVSGVQDLVAVYRNLAARCGYPLHLGLTEAGMGSKGIVASTAAMAVLLQEGIGDTIRVSLTPEPNGDRTQEVIVAQEILQTMGLRAFTPMVIACPAAAEPPAPISRSWRRRSKAISATACRVAQAAHRGRGHDRRRHGMRGQRTGREQAREYRYQSAGDGRASRRAGIRGWREDRDAQG